MATTSKKLPHPFPVAYGKWIILQECAETDEVKTPSGLVLTPSVNSDVRMGKVIAAAGTDTGETLLFVKRKREDASPRWADFRIGADTFIAVQYEDVICRLDEGGLDAGDGQ